MIFVSKRIPLDERMHGRDLEAALTLSLLNNLNDRLDQARSSGLSLQNKHMSRVELASTNQCNVFIFRGCKSSGCGR